MIHNTEEFKLAVKEATEEATKKALSETLMKLGIDTKNPIELQADMLHLRQSRKAQEQAATIIRSVVFKTLAVSALAGLILVFVMAVKEKV